MQNLDFRSIGRVFLLAVLAFGLEACSPGKPLSEQELTEAHQFRPEFQVEHTVHTHLVPIDPSKIDFREQQRRDLYDFLVGVGAQPGDKVIVAARRNRLDHRKDVVRFVRELGLVPDLRLIKDLKPGNEGDGYDRAVLIQFDRYVTRDPDCGRWKDTFTNRFYNASPPNYGCANTAALQQQIAYPSSLIVGETLDFPEGDVAAESISRYRGRKVEQIKVEAANSK